MTFIQSTRFSVYLIALLVSIASCSKKIEVVDDFFGSESCIECHAHFYELWSTSHHGLAMQPITAAFIKNEITVEQSEIEMEDALYSVVVTDSLLYIQEKKDNITTNYNVLWALGGKNVYYFLTPLNGGRLQTLPLAYDVHSKKWYNNPQSAVRHFSSMGSSEADEALPWKHQQYTFNTSCYSCHVSQLSNNFDLTTNTYQTHWKESGINCETCHGPANEHIESARLAEKQGLKLIDLKLVVTSTFTAEQHNASCGSCHAKMRAITSSFMPGSKFFDNYDLTTLESSDFYPDGRDLGENYTMTGWHMNKCAQASEMHCVTCHTSSGRYRFASNDLKKANYACTSCHADKESNYEVHTHHSFADDSPKCVDCHMPQTRFGNMTRSDHSFRPPMPKASMEFGSPNACNLCHKNENAQWAQKTLDKWGKNSKYQNRVLEAGRLLIAARNEDWSKIALIKKAIETDEFGEVYTTSFLRLLVAYPDSSKRNTILKVVNHPSALVRSSAVNALYGFTDGATKTALLVAAADSILLVRLAAANGLSLMVNQLRNEEEVALFRKVNDEYIQSLITRKDDWSSYYNLGNYYFNFGQANEALHAFETAHKLNNETILPLVNSSMIYSATGNNIKAEEYLLKALEIDADNEAANFNYALLMAELKQFDKAETSLRKVISINNENAAAAYNLSILMAERDLSEACDFARIAYRSAPENPRYGYTYAFYLHQNKETKKAIDILNESMKRHPDYTQNIQLMEMLQQAIRQENQK